MKLKEWFRPFKRLQWKLTISYTSVTVGSLLVVVLILAYILFSSILVPNQILDTALSPQAWINVASRKGSEKWQYILSQDPIDTELVSLTLRDGDMQISYFDVLQVGDLQVRIRTLGEASVVIIRPDGIVLGSSNDEFVSKNQIGHVLDVDLLPGLGPVIQAAVSGENDPERLFVTLEPYERFYFAVPYYADDTHAVIAVALIYFSDLPTEDDLPANLISVLWKSIILFLLGAGVIGTIFGWITARGMANRLRKVSERTEAWSKGDFTEFIQDPMADEISQLAQQLNHMAKQLADLLINQRDMAVSEERNRLARDLHDSAKQEALAASFQLGTAITLYDSDPEKARSHLAKAEELVDSVRQELTDLIHQLRPLDGGMNFSQTVSDYLIDWAHQNDLEANFTRHGSGEISLEIKQAAYRIIQEALANIARHSQAETVNLDLTILDSGIEFSIRDDGVGFDPQLPRQGMGMLSMRERAEALGGTLQVTSEIGKGTVVTAFIPMHAVRGKYE